MSAEHFKYITLKYITLKYISLRYITLIVLEYRVVFIKMS